MVLKGIARKCLALSMKSLGLVGESFETTIVFYKGSVSDTCKMQWFKGIYIKRPLEPLIYARVFSINLYDASAACPPTSSGVCIPVSIQYA